MLILVIDFQPKLNLRFLKVFFFQCLSSVLKRKVWLQLNSSAGYKITTVWGCNADQSMKLHYCDLEVHNYITDTIIITFRPSKFNECCEGRNNLIVPITPIKTLIIPTFFYDSWTKGKFWMEIPSKIQRNSMRLFFEILTLHLKSLTLILRWFHWNHLAWWCCLVARNWSTKAGVPTY